MSNQNQVPEWMQAPMSAVVNGIKHFGRASKDRPYAHGHRVQIIGDKTIKHFLNFRKEKEAKTEVAT
jgi:hypothetical protein